MDTGWVQGSLIHVVISLGPLLPRDPNTIFRGNSLTSKCIDETMKLAGMHYLQVTLKPIIDEVLFIALSLSLFVSLSHYFSLSLLLSSLYSWVLSFVFHFS